MWSNSITINLIFFKFQRAILNDCEGQNAHFYKPSLKEKRSDAQRPQTAEFAAQRPFHVDDPLPVTTNGEFHNAKAYSKPSAIRSATASGTRSNNPHPKYD